jgi:hypothetical protein
VCAAGRGGAGGGRATGAVTAGGVLARWCNGGRRHWWAHWAGFSFFVFEKNLRRELIGPLSAYPPRGVPPALGEDAFADPFGVRNLAVSEGLESGSDLGSSTHFFIYIDFIIILCYCFSTKIWSPPYYSLEIIKFLHAYITVWR